MKTKIFLLGAASLLLASCSSELDVSLNEALGSGKTNLSINVVTENIESKGLVTDSYLPSGAAIGVTVLNTSGGNYDGTAYNNIKFTSSGTGTGQTWSGASTVKLSATEGYCYAYYPYSSSVTDITNWNLSVTDQIDYMYASPATVNDKSKTATLTMKHALSAIRFALKRGTYAGTGAVSAVKATSNYIATTASLNIKTGGLSFPGGVTKTISTNKSLTLSSTTQNVDLIVTPLEADKYLTLTVTIDGKDYSTQVKTVMVRSGTICTYTLTVNAGSLSLSGVKVGDWGYNEGGAPTITAAGYTVTFAGNYSDIAFTNSVSGSNVTIRAVNVEGWPVKAVTSSGTATLSQSVSGMVRSITLSGVGSDVTVTFNGYAVPPAAIADSWSGLSDGVYAIRPDGKPANASDGNEACIGAAFVIKGKAYQVAKVNATGYNGAEKVYWHKTGYSDISGLENFTKVDGTNNNGYLAGTSTPQLSRDPATWTAGALSDFNGQTNTVTILAAQSGGTLDYTIGKAVMDFRSGSNNEGYNDWFIPSCGELAYIFLKKTELNTLLEKVSGSAFSNSFYWASSESSSGKAWGVLFGNGGVNSNGKNSFSYFVRLVRAI